MSSDGTKALSYKYWSTGVVKEASKDLPAPLDEAAVAAQRLAAAQRQASGASAWNAVRIAVSSFG
jgi:hypothetical protein